MTSPLETELRSALAQRAANVPPDAIERLRAVDYHPQTRSSRTRLVLSGSGVAAIATAAGIAISTIGPGVQSAFASWSPTPTTPVSGQVTAAETTCSTSVDVLAQHPLPVSEGPGPFGNVESWQPTAEDVRGLFTLVSYQGATGSTTDVAACLSGGSSWPVGPQVLMAETDPASSLSASGVANEAATWNRASGDTVALGQVGSAVTGVTLSLSDGTQIVTTVGNGYFTAWWPSDATMLSAVVTTAQGTVSQAIPASASDGFPSVTAEGSLGPTGTGRGPNK
jgi:hypothetical protein